MRYVCPYCGATSQVSDQYPEPRAPCAGCGRMISLEEYRPRQAAVERPDPNQIIKSASRGAMTGTGLGCLVALFYFGPAAVLAALLMASQGNASGPQPLWVVLGMAAIVTVTAGVLGFILMGVACIFTQSSPSQSHKVQVGGLLGAILGLLAGFLLFTLPALIGLTSGPPPALFHALWIVNLATTAAGAFVGSLIGIAAAKVGAGK